MSPDPRAVPSGFVAGLFGRSLTLIDIWLELVAVQFALGSAHAAICPLVAPTLVCKPMAAEFPELELMPAITPGWPYPAGSAARRDSRSQTAGCAASRSPPWC